MFIFNAVCFDSDNIDSCEEVRSFKNLYPVISCPRTTASIHIKFLKFTAHLEYLSLMDQYINILLTPFHSCCYYYLERSNQILEI